LPILHFSGKFRNQPPLYNNEPSNPEIAYDPHTTPDDVKKNITEKVEPVEYFEFTFHDVFIRNVTYDDGSSPGENEKDAIIGKRLMLKGLLVDVAPHLLRSRLFAGEFRIVDLMMGKLEEGFESDLFTTIRVDPSPNDKGDRPLPYSADFECGIYDTQSLAGNFVSRENSRFFRESDLANSKFKMYFHLSKFYYSTLEGEVHGYLGLHVPDFDRHGVRIQGRRLLVDPSISEELKRDFKIESYEEESKDMGRNDLEGTYDIMVEKKLIVLRFLNFIPYVDTNNRPPSGYTFFIKLTNNGNEIKSKFPSEIKVDRKSISYSGGISIVRFPDDISDLSMLVMSIETKKNNNETGQSFMKEPQYDLLISNDQKYLVLESAKKEELKVQAYRNNSPYKNKNIDIKLETYAGSPTVARWTSSSATPDNDSILTCYVQASDLEHFEEMDEAGSDELQNKKTSGKLSGDLRWDQYYGNYVSIRIDNNSIINSDNKKHPMIKFNIPARVLHSVRLDDEIKNAIDNLDNEKIQGIMTKILSYYTRYYPWLHTEYVYAGLPSQPAKLAYRQFLDITKWLRYVNKNDIGNWGSVKESVISINHFLDRLTRKDNDWKKMPRSRDFPVNGVEFLKMYKQSILDKVVNAIKSERDRTIKSIGGGGDVEIDTDDWSQMQTLLKNLEEMSNRLSSDEDKRLVAISKLQIYDELINRLSIAKTHTEHVHIH